MEKRKLVYQGITRTGLPITIGYPVMEDVIALKDFINVLSLEESFILLQGRQFSEEEERKYVENILEQIEKKKVIKLLVFTGEKFIGSSDINLKSDAVAHEGVFGITLAKEYRGQGIGRLLMDFVLKEAEKEMPELKIVTLGVFGDNLIAKKMYESFGFVEFGRLPKGILHKGKYVDHIYMYKNLQEL